MMKITHICLANYNDNWGYQENLLPEYQYKRGDDVTVIASSKKFASFLNEEEILKTKSKGSKYKINGVNIRRIKTYLNTQNSSFIIWGLYRNLCDLSPDLIFHHGVSLSSLLIVYAYALVHKEVVVMVDNHADIINQTKNKLWFSVYYHIILRLTCKLVGNRVSCFYGVSRLRCDFLHDVYGVNNKKIDILPLGFDLDQIENISSDKRYLRLKYGIPLESFVIISGGKMGKSKGTDLLIRYLESHSNHNMHLVLFGKFEDDQTFELAKQTNNVSIEGWCERKKTLELLKLSDLAVWPLLHTTLIEDAVACSSPLIVKQSGNVEHLICGNGIAIDNGTYAELEKSINSVYSNYKPFLDNAILIKEKYSYKIIANMIEQKWLLAHY
ncbi:MAG: glycosyltransferase [Bacteroides sp.]|nr:glycosyltransferase [Bacteroides sp.]